MRKKKPASAGKGEGVSNEGRKPQNGTGNGNKPRFVTSFRHWRSGKLIVASDYGYKGFPIGG